jgi:hypothetical protein
VLRLAISLALASLLGAGCAGTGPMVTDATLRQDHARLEADTLVTLERACTLAPSTRTLLAQAAGVLVFPTVVMLNPVTGERAGNGVLRKANTVTDYYLVSAGQDIEHDHRAQAIVVLFMTRSALIQFQHADPWRTGTSQPDAEAFTEPAEGHFGVGRSAPEVRLLVLEAGTIRHDTGGAISVVRLPE